MKDTISYLMPQLNVRGNDKATFLDIFYKESETRIMNSNNAPSALSIWLWAARPRTLPLAASAIILGYGLTVSFGGGNAAVFFLALLTALLLQVLSNLANDYGDAVAGTDTGERLGPLRMVAGGLTSANAMLRAVILASALTVISGSALVFLAVRDRPYLLLFFLALGAACVAAAVLYTVGKRPYGYYGLGDFMAGFFFGPVAVWGSAVLCGAPFSRQLFLPGLAAGFCSTMVLNVNNIRDITTDEKAGKRTVAVRLGRAGAVRYHAALACCVILCWAVFWLAFSPRFLPGLVLAAPLLRSAYYTVTRAADASCLNAQLKNTVIGSAICNTGMAVLLAFS